MVTNLAAEIAEVAMAHPEADAIVADGRRVSYRELMQGTARLAGVLRARGVQRGDRVLIFSETRPEYAMALLACARLGAVLATAYPSFGPDELSYIMTNSSPRLALVETRLLDEFTAAAARDRRDLSIVDLIDAVAPVHAERSVWQDEPTSAGDGVLICYTSGTTTFPKAVFHSHGGLIKATRAHIDTWDVTPGDRLLVMAPMAWLFGIVTTCLTGLLSGASLVMLPRFNPLKVSQILERDGVTITIGVGTMYLKLAQVARDAGLERVPTSLRLCLSGGEARSDAGLNRFHAIFGCPVHDVYAASECFPLVTYDPRVDPEPRATASGRVVAGAEVRFIDENGADLPPGEVGEVIGRGAASMIGYFGEPDLTASVVDSDGWFHTKDLGYIDETGLVYIVGRTSDMIIRGGANISPAEVERVLSGHRAVGEVAVVGLPDELYGQRVVAFVVPEGGESTDESSLMAYAGERIAKYKVPSSVVFVDELPKTTTGKVLRSALRV